MDREVLNTILSDLKECGVKFDGSLIDGDGNTHTFEEVLEGLDELESDVKKLRQLIGWAKTMPSVDTE